MSNRLSGSMVASGERNRHGLASEEEGRNGKRAQTRDRSGVSRFPRDLHDKRSKRPTVRWRQFRSASRSSVDHHHLFPYGRFLALRFTHSARLTHYLAVSKLANFSRIVLNTSKCQFNLTGTLYFHFWPSEKLDWHILERGSKSTEKRS